MGFPRNGIPSDTPVSAMATYRWLLRVRYAAVTTDLCIRTAYHVATRQNRLRRIALFGACDWQTRPFDTGITLSPTLMNGPCGNYPQVATHEPNSRCYAEVKPRP